MSSQQEDWPKQQIENPTGIVAPERGLIITMASQQEDWHPANHKSNRKPCPRKKTHWETTFQFFWPSWLPSVFANPIFKYVCYPDSQVCFAIVQDVVSLLTRFLNMFAILTFKCLLLPSKLFFVAFHLFVALTLKLFDLCAPMFNCFVLTWLLSVFVTFHTFLLLFKCCCCPGFQVLFATPTFKFFGHPDFQVSVIVLTFEFLSYLEFRVLLLRCETIVLGEGARPSPATLE